MTRIWLVASLLYGWGGPAFDGSRPAALDRPLRELHRSVNAGVKDARRGVAAFEDLNAIPAMVASLRRLNDL